MTFSAAVKTFDYIEDGGVLRFSCKAKVSGKPTYAADPVQLSALTISSGTLYPTFAAGTYNYFATASASPITVTPTSAGATITVNGTAVTSGQASGNITLTTGAINEVIISVAKDAKTTTFYKILVGR
ncbi:MAG: cadherin-like beta sandwich domain-containing protein [Ignavibacteria bacterium]|nr:cadherin-like beta sandwich domain-containing protein [Ignavibacteria bacterium]